MPRYAVLLRGVNVGGRSKLAMADLRALLSSLGYTDVTTYLQSGNALISSPDGPGRVEGRIEEALAAEVGMTTRVLVRTGADLSTVIEQNPFPDAVDAKPPALHVAFLSAQPDPAHAAELDPDAWAPDRFGLGDRAVYLWYAHGSQQSKLAAGVLGQLARGDLGLAATSRNWNTVRTLADRLSG